jgi:hypothetical protein
MKQNRASWRPNLLILTVGLVVACAGGARDALAQSAPTDRILVRLDGGWRPASRTFASTQFFTLFSERGNFQADYKIQGGGIMDGGLSFLLWRYLAVGLDVSNYTSTSSANITTAIPHPFFYDLPRNTTGVAGGLTRRELAVHFNTILVMNFTDWFVVSMSIGPSLINAKQDLVTAIQHVDGPFPYDEIIFKGPTIGRRSTSTIGANAGIHLDTYVLHRLPWLNRYDAMEHVGFGLLFRYIRGSVDLRIDDTPLDVDLGGLQVTTGFRFRF